MGTGVIYMYTNMINGKKYVGQTWDPNRRHSDHKRADLDTPFHRAIRLHGFSNFSYEILHEKLDTQQNMNDLETQEILTHDCLAPKGYNLSSGGSNGKHHPNVRKKISDAKRGVKLSEAHRKSISLVQMGHIMPEKTRAAIARANVGRKCSDELKEKIAAPQRGRKFTEEHKAKIAATRRRKRTRCIETGIVYDSLSVASTLTGIDKANMSASCLGKARTAGGYHWEYVNE